MKHDFHPQTETCLGCQAARFEVADGKVPLECPAVYGKISPKLRYVISTDEELSLWIGAKCEEVLIRFAPEETTALRDAIDEGIGKLRAVNGSAKVARSGEYGDD